MKPRRVDIAIVGASFAGLVCAAGAARRGLKTVVIEAKSDPGARIHTTGIFVKEAAAEIDFPRRFARTIRSVRLYAPSLRHIDLQSPDYYFLTTDTAALMRWLTAEAQAAGAAFLCGSRATEFRREGDIVALPQFGLETRYLVGADGARSGVARAFGLSRNGKFLTGLEFEYDALPRAGGDMLHCFLDTRLAPGYLAWVAPAPGFFQAGLAVKDGARADLKAFLAKTEHLFGFGAAAIRERRSGLIPCGGPLAATAAGNVLLIGDAAGHVSPLTGGGIAMALRHGKLAAHAIAEWLARTGPPPETVIAAALPSFGLKLALRRAMDLGPPNWLYDLLIGTAPMRWAAERIYFHRRGRHAAENSGRR
jgi:flavin-dependent dehydrogenase